MKKTTNLDRIYSVLLQTGSGGATYEEMAKLAGISPDTCSSELSALEAFGYAENRAHVYYAISKDKMPSEFRREGLSAIGGMSDSTLQNYLLCHHALQKRYGRNIWQGIAKEREKQKAKRRPARRKAHPHNFKERIFGAN